MNNGIWFVLIKEIYICSKQIKTIYSCSNLLHVSFYDFMCKTIINFYFYISVYKENFSSFISKAGDLFIFIVYYMYNIYLMYVYVTGYYSYSWLPRLAIIIFLKNQEAYTTHTAVKIKKNTIAQSYKDIS